MESEHSWLSLTVLPTLVTNCEQGCHTGYCRITYILVLGVSINCYCHYNIILFVVKYVLIASVLIYFSLKFIGHNPKVPHRRRVL
jgi:hypothetical protein